MSRRMMTLLLAIAVLAPVAGAAQSHRTAWKAPDAGPLAAKSGEKVVALVVSAKDSDREAAENDLVAALNGRGVEGVAAHALVPGPEGLAVQKLKPAIEESGASAVVALRVAKEGTAGGRESWQHWNWGPAYSVGTPVAGMLFVQTRVFDLEQGKLVWIGQSQVVAPRDTDEAVRQVLDAVSTRCARRA